jgi:hypothetical protein
MGEPIPRGQAEAWAREGNRECAGRVRHWIEPVPELPANLLPQEGGTHGRAAP